ncbi:unnamed protein product, partial [Prorocentrum cordatum]
MGRTVLTSEIVPLGRYLRGAGSSPDATLASASAAPGIQCRSAGGGGGAPSAPRVVLLREHRLEDEKEPRLVDSARRWASKGGLNSVFGQAESRGGEANESSSGVAVLSPLPLLDGFAALQDALPRGRCQVGVVNTGLGVPLHCISIYLTTKVGLAEPNLSHLERLLVQEWARLVHGVVVAPDSPTFGEKVLDFFVVSRVLGNFVRNVDVVEVTAIRAHAPVRLRLHGLHAEAKVRRAVLPVAYPIVLPPPTRAAPQEVGDGAWPWEAGGLPGDLHVATQAWFKRAEEYLSCLHGCGGRREGRCLGLREQRVPFATEWQSQLKARTSAEYRCLAGLLAASQRAASLQAVMRSKGWLRYSALNQQLQVITAFAVEGGWWPQSGVLANMSVDKLLKVLGSDSASASPYLLQASAYVRTAQVRPAVIETLDDDSGLVLPLGGDAAMEFLMRQWEPLWVNPDRADEVHPREWTGRESHASSLPRLQ